MRTTVRQLRRVVRSVVQESLPPGRSRHFPRAFESEGTSIAVQRALDALLDSVEDELRDLGDANSVAQARIELEEQIEAAIKEAKRLCASRSH